MMVLLMTAAPVAAQQARPSVLAIDSVAEADVTTDNNGNETKGVFLDSLVVAAFGKNVAAMVRPQVQRLAGTGEWNNQIWVAELRYERQGPIAVRAEGGYIPSPVGLANLTLRPQLNPTIGLPAELFTSIPSLEVRGPRINLLSGIYPLGAQATVSATHWDARVAIIDTSPLRLRRVFANPDPPLFAGNPPRFTNVVFGGGVTPFVGFRIGATVTRGGWLKAGESASLVDRSATLVDIETELSFRHTSLAGEWVHDALDTTLGTRSASGWYVQGAQNLTPRLFVAGRYDSISTILPLTTDPTLDFRNTEQTLGYRLTPELTLRASHRMRQAFGRTTWDHFEAVSIVWYRRWM
jgi:hypothetical protein